MDSAGELKALVEGEVRGMIDFHVGCVRRHMGESVESFISDASWSAIARHAERIKALATQCVALQQKNMELIKAMRQAE